MRSSSDLEGSARIHLPRGVTNVAMVLVARLVATRSERSLTMGSWLLTTFCLALWSQASAQQTYYGHRVIRIDVESPERWEELEGIFSNLTQEVDIWSSPSTLDPFADVSVSAEQLRQLDDLLRSAGFRFVIRINDIQRLWEESQKVQPGKSPEDFHHRRHKRDTSNTLDNSIIGTYARFDDIQSYLFRLEEFVPEIASLKIIGYTYEERPLRLLQLGIPRDFVKPALWIDGGVHAREWISPATVMYVIYRLVKGFLEGDTEIKGYLTNFDWYILPVANPDGYELSHLYSRYWRKNVSPNNGSECNGTDINRNWDFHWGEVRASSDPCNIVYRGPYAASELETQAMSQALLGLRSRLFTYFNVHSYAQTWFVRWSYSREPAELYNETIRIANMAVKAINDEGGAEFRAGRSSDILYAYSGGSPDWAHAVAGIRYSFALELRDRGRWGFALPATYIDVSGREIYQGLRVVMSQLCNLTCHLTNLTDDYDFNGAKTRQPEMFTVTLCAILAFCAAFIAETFSHGKI